ncbi:P-loop NTPase fold protein [Xanthomonas arboricola]|uniref:P-loop NTPase fold protein n=1 Tax=Xanthomonas arboricola TaxID=56448 RepID=UPI00128FA88E
MQQLDIYLQKPQPGYAILISGAWGVGKSHNVEPLRFQFKQSNTSHDLRSRP